MCWDDNYKVVGSNIVWAKHLTSYLLQGQNEIVLGQKLGLKSQKMPVIVIILPSCPCSLVLRQDHDRIMVRITWCLGHVLVLSCYITPPPCYSRLVIIGQLAWCHLFPSLVSPYIIPLCCVSTLCVIFCDSPVSTLSESCLMRIVSLCSCLFFFI